MIYSAKIVQASGMTKQNTQFLFFIPERRLYYEKIVQMSEKASSLLECFSECSLSYEKRDLYNVENKSEKYIIWKLINK